MKEQFIEFVQQNEYGKFVYPLGSVAYYMQTGLNLVKLLLTIGQKSVSENVLMTVVTLEQAWVDHYYP